MSRERIFVFGSNLGGIHGAGSALAARRMYGAELGVGIGPTGRAYAIPTKDAEIKNVLPLSEISGYVGRFILHARFHPELDFDVVKIGCGRAGYTDQDVAPLFKDASNNVLLPLGWRAINGEEENPESQARLDERGF